MPPWTRPCAWPRACAPTAASPTKCSSVCVATRAGPSSSCLASRAPTSAPRRWLPWPRASPRPQTDENLDRTTEGGEPPAPLGPPAARRRRRCATIGRRTALEDHPARGPGAYDVSAGSGNVADDQQDTTGNAIFRGGMIGRYIVVGLLGN